MPNTDSAHPVDRDAEQLKALGYTSNFDRTMSKWENFSLGFTYLSPVVGVYTIFTSAFVAGGPPMWWTYLLVGLGQLMVCLVFGEIVSQFPISGGLYPWARRLVGKRWAWTAGWVYMWALCCTMAGVATGVAPFIAQLFGMESTPLATTLIALFLIGMTTFLNLSGTRLLARVAMFGFICELVGAIVVGGTSWCSPGISRSTSWWTRPSSMRKVTTGRPSWHPRLPRCSAITVSRPAGTWPKRLRMPAA